MRSQNLKFLDVWKYSPSYVLSDWRKTFRPGCLSPTITTITNDTGAPEQLSLVDKVFETESLWLDGVWAQPVGRCLELTESKFTAHVILNTSSRHGTAICFFSPVLKFKQFPESQQKLISSTMCSESRPWVNKLTYLLTYCSIVHCMKETNSGKEPNSFDRVTNGSSMSLSTPCPQKVSQSVFVTKTLKIGHKFPSNLAYSYSNQCWTVCVKIIHFTWRVYTLYLVMLWKTKFWQNSVIFM